MAIKPGPELISALGKRRPGMGSAPAPAPDAPDPEDGGDLKVAMQELIEALNAGDASAAAEAFKSAHEICSSYE